MYFKQKPVIAKLNKTITMHDVCYCGIGIAPKQWNAVSSLGSGLSFKDSLTHSPLLMDIQN